MQSIRLNNSELGHVTQSETSVSMAEVANPDSEQRHAFSLLGHVENQPAFDSFSVNVSPTAADAALYL